MPQTATQDQEFTNVRPINQQVTSEFTNVRPIAAAALSHPPDILRGASQATSIGPRPTGPKHPFDEALGLPSPSEAGNWFNDLLGDVRYGTTTTLPGRVLHAMGAKGTNYGIPESAGEFIGGPAIGPVRALHGATQLGTHPVRAANEIVSGIGQAVAPLAGVAMPNAIPAATRFMGTSTAVSKGLTAVGTNPEVSELAGNIAGAASFGVGKLKPPPEVAGMTKVGKGLGLPTSDEAISLAGKKAPDVINAAHDLRLVRSDLATIERSNPVNVKGSAGTFARAKNILDYSRQIWQDAHVEPIARNANRPIQHADLVDAAMRELTPEAIDADPAGARRAQRWVEQSINKPRTIDSADKLIRELNNDLEKSPADRYGPLFSRVKSSVASATRNAIDNTLADAGESGVRESNRRYGALITVAQRAIDAGMAEAKVEAKAGPIPPWLNVYTFVHTGGISEGLSVHPGAIFSHKSSKNFAAGMQQLAGSTLEAPPKIGAPSKPAIKGLLPAPPEPLPWTDASGPTSGLPTPRTVSAGEIESTRLAQLPRPPAERQVSGPPKLGFPAKTTNPMWEGTQPKSVMMSSLRPPENVKGPSIRADLKAAAPASGIVGAEFKNLKLSNLVTPRQQLTLETLINGPRYKSMDAVDKAAAIRSVLSGKGQP